MTTNVIVSVNGAYKVGVKVTGHDGRPEEHYVVSGLGAKAPVTQEFSCSHAGGQVIVGPEEPDVAT